MPVLQKIAYKIAVIDAAAGDNDIVAAVSGKRIKVAHLHMVIGGGGTAVWKSDATALTADPTYAAGDIVNITQTPLSFLLATDAGEKLVLTLGAGTAKGWLVYWDTDDA